MVDRVLQREGIGAAVRRDLDREDIATARAGLQRPNPSIELLRREFVLQSVDALLPNHTRQNKPLKTDKGRPPSKKNKR